jgi:hypothetical protein
MLHLSPAGTPTVESEIDGINFAAIQALQEFFRAASVKPNDGMMLFAPRYRVPESGSFAWGFSTEGHGYQGCGASCVTTRGNMVSSRATRLAETVVVIKGDWRFPYGRSIATACYTAVVQHLDGRWMVAQFLSARCGACGCV